MILWESLSVPESPSCKELRNLEPILTVRSNNLQYTVLVILMKFSFNSFTYRGSLER